MDQETDFLTHSKWKSPTRCFCQFSPEALKKWARRRYCENLSTIDLLSSTDDPSEREMISAVALLDVDQEVVLQMMSDVNMPEHHIIHCLEDLRKTVGSLCQM